MPSQGERGEDFCCLIGVQSATIMLTWSPKGIPGATRQVSPMRRRVSTDGGMAHDTRVLRRRRGDGACSESEGGTSNVSSNSVQANVSFTMVPITSYFVVGKGNICAKTLSGTLQRLRCSSSALRMM